MIADPARREKLNAKINAALKHKRGAAPIEEPAPFMVLQKKPGGPAEIIDVQKPRASLAASLSSLDRLPDEFRLLPLEAIEPSTTNRTDFDAEEMAGLVESIRARGVLEPIVVRPVSDADGRVSGRWQIVMGERRWRAAPQAGLREIPCIIRILSDRDALIDQLTENLQREDLRPLDEARGYAHMKEMGMKVEEIAEQVKVSRAVVYGRLKLLELPGAAREALAAGTLQPSFAELLTTIPDEAAQTRLAAEFLKTRVDWKGDKEQLSFRDAKELADAAKKEIDEEAKWQKETAEYRQKGGYKIFTRKQSEKCFHYGSLKAGYVGAGDQCEHDVKGRTWKALLGEHAPEAIVARNGHGPQVLYARKAAEKALPLAGHKIATAAEGVKQNREATLKLARELREQERERKLASDRARVAKVVAAAEARELNADALRLVANAMTESCDVEHLLRSRGLYDESPSAWKKNNDALEKLIGGADGRRLRGLLLELVLWTYDGADAETLAAAEKLYGIKLPASGRKGKGPQI